RLRRAALARGPTSSKHEVRQERNGNRNGAGPELSPMLRRQRHRYQHHSHPDNPNITQPREAPHGQRWWGEPRLLPCPSSPHLRHRDGKINQRDDGTGSIHQEGKHDAWREYGGDHSSESESTCEQYGARGYLATVGMYEPTWRISPATKNKQHPG